MIHDSQSLADNHRIDKSVPNWAIPPAGVLAMVLSMPGVVSRWL